MRSWLRKLLPDLLIVSALFIVPLAFFWQQTLGGRTLVPAENLFQWQPYKALAAQYGVSEVHNGLYSDLILENYAWRKFVSGQVKQGQIPLWQPNILAGTPFLAAGQSLTLYPFSILYLILPLWLAYGWFTVVQFWLAGLDAYLFARALRIGRAGAVIAALTYQLSGFFMASVVFPMILAAAAWLPLVLAMIEKIVCTKEGLTGKSGRQDKTILWVIVGALGLGLTALAGHVEALYFTLLVMAFYAAWRLVTSSSGLRPRSSSAQAARRNLTWMAGRAAWLAGMVGLGLALGAIQIAPAYELATRSFREGTVTLNQVKDWAYPARHVLAFLMPNVFGNPSHHQIFDLFAWKWVPVTVNAQGNPITTTEWGIKNYVEGAAYVGILPMLLAAIGVVRWLRDRIRRKASGPDEREEPQSPLAFMVLSLLSVSFIFGTPTYNLLYYGLPYFNQSHSPFRWVWPLTLCLAVLAAYGVEYLTPRSGDNEPAEARGLTTLLAQPGMLFGWGAVACGAAIMIGLVLVRADYASFGGVVEHVFRGMALAPNAFADARAFFSYEAANASILALMLILSGGVILMAQTHWALGGGLLQVPVWQATAAILVIMDLFIASWGLAPASDPKLLDVVPPSIQWLKDHQAENPNQPFRVMPYIAPGSTKTMNANIGWLTGLEDATGYDSLLPEQYVNYMRVIMPQGDLPYNRIAPIYEAQADALDSPLLDLLGVKYIVSETPISNPRYMQVYQDDAVRIYENTGVMPRAFTLPTAATQVDTHFATAATKHDVRAIVLIDSASCVGNPQPLQTLCASLSSGNAGTPVPAGLTVYKAGEVWIDAEVDAQNWLIVADSYFPGWRAWVRPIGGTDAQEAEIPVYPVDGNFQGMLLNQGRWTVRMKYSPDSFKFGALGTLLAGMALVFLAGVWAWPRLYREEGTGSDARRVAKNALTPILLNLFTKGILFALTFVSLRVLGPAGTGDYTYAVVIWGWFDIFTNFGLNTYLTREVARHKDQAGSYLASTTFLRLGLAALGIPALAAFIAIRQAVVQPPLNSQTIWTIGLLYAGLFFSTMSYGLTALFYAFEKAEYPAAIQTISAFLTAALGISALLIGYGIIGLAVVSIVVNGVTLAILATLAFRMFDLAPRLTLRKVKAGSLVASGGAEVSREALRESFPLMINNLLATLFFRIDVVLLEALKGAVVVGWYRVVYTWVDAIGVIPSFFTLSLFPVMSRQAAEDRPALRRAYVLAIKLMTLLSIPTVIFTVLLAPFLVNVLGGPQYLPHGAIALQIFIWAMIVGWMNSVTQYVIIALNRQRTLTIAFAVGAAFNIITNLIFIPLYSYVASSLITILSEMVLWVVFYAILSSELGWIRWGAALWRIAVAGAVCAAATFGLASVNKWLALVVGVAIYGAMLIAVRPLNTEESQVFMSLLPEGIRRQIGFRGTAEV